jgi:hypothetical protein
MHRYYILIVLISFRGTTVIEWLLFCIISPPYTRYPPSFFVSLFQYLIPLKKSSEIVWPDFISTGKRLFPFSINKSISFPVLSRQKNRMSDFPLLYRCFRKSMITRFSNRLPLKGWRFFTILELNSKIVKNTKSTNGILSDDQFSTHCCPVNDHPDYIHGCRIIGKVQGKRIGISACCYKLRRKPFPLHIVYFNNSFRIIKT